MARTCPPHLPPQTFSNIDLDGFSSEDLRDEVVAHLGATNEAGIKNAYGDWCNGKLASGHSGPTVEFEANERVGRLRYRDGYVHVLADLLRQDQELGGIDETDIQDFVSWLCGETANIEAEAAGVLFNLLLADKRFEPGRGWYFRSDTHGPTPFPEDDLECLPWKLGLPYVASKSKYVGFDLPASGLDTPRQVTFVDVQWEYHEFWRPNGRTEPRQNKPELCDGTGFEELMAGAPKFSDVIIPLKPVEAR